MVEHTVIFSKTILVEKLKCNYLATALVDILSKLERCVALSCVTKLDILECPFIVPSTRCTCVRIMLFIDLLHMPHLSGG
jgi:hypothetical protein